MNRQQHIQETSAIQRRYEVKYFPRVKSAIQVTIDEVIAVVNKHGVQAGIGHLNKQIANTKLTEIIQSLALEVGLRFARRQWQSLQQDKRNAKHLTLEDLSKILEVHLNQKGFGFNAEWVDWIKRFLFDFIVQKISFSVFETTKDVLLTTLNNAITNGWGIDKTVKELEDLPLSATQAARIVRTEITRATNAGASAAAETFPFQQKKEWISAHDKRVRDSNHASHVMLDGQVVDYEDVFYDPASGAELRWPGDPNAPAAETINCRCTHAVTAKLDSNGRLIPKRVHVAVIYPSRRRQQQTVLI